MAAPDYKVRFKDAASMLNYGFSKCSLYIDKKMEALPEIPVRNGKKKTVPWFMKNSSLSGYHRTEYRECKKKAENPQGSKGPGEKNTLVQGR